MSTQPHASTNHSSHLGANSEDDGQQNYFGVPEHLPSAPKFPSSRTNRRPAAGAPRKRPAEHTPSQQQSNQEQSRAAQQDESGKASLSSPCEDFIEIYVQFADVMEAPTELHEGVAISVVGAVLNSNGVTIHNGSDCLSLDIWLVLLSGSGGGRSSMVRIPGRILERAGLGYLLRREAWGSVQAMYVHFATNPAGLNIWGEMSEKLKELGDSRFGNGKAWLTDRYDETRPPDNRKYRKTGREDGNGNSLDTPDIDFSGAPRTNFLATSSVAWFFHYLTASDSTGGFIPRWMICRAKDTGRLIPTPEPLDDSLLGPLASRLKEIANLRGVADLSIILPLYQEWYRETYGRFKAQANSDLAMVFWHRHRGHILKLAVVYEASRSGTLKVSVAAWERAKTKARQLEETIFGFLDTNMNEEGYRLKQMEERVRETGEKGLPKHEFTSAFKTDPYRENRLKTLIAAQTLSVYQLPSKGGRPGQVLVHPDFETGYITKYCAAKEGKSPALVGEGSTKGDKG